MLEQQLDPFDIEIELERDELAVLLDRALAQLPATTRAALLARYIEEQPVAKIAAQLGLSENATAVRLHRGKLALRQTLTSALRDETSAYTLVRPNDTTRVTSIWCPFCGQHRLIVRHSHADRYTFWLGCPDCRSVAGRYFVLMQHTRPFVEPLNDHHLIAHITAEVSQRFRQDLARGVTLCHRCGRRLAMRMSIPGASHPSGGARIAGTRCLRCDIESWIYFSELVLYLPESQRFWHKHGRIRTLPERAVAAEGRTALITRFETLDACAYLEVVALRDTAEVVYINESAQ
jgi:RNA polymerase sigma-70 factor (ECF subfamily)